MLSSKQTTPAPSKAFGEVSFTAEAKRLKDVARTAGASALLQESRKLRQHSQAGGRGGWALAVAFGSIEDIDTAEVMQHIADLPVRKKVSHFNGSYVQIVLAKQSKNGFSHSIGTIPDSQMMLCTPSRPPFCRLSTRGYCTHDLQVQQSQLCWSGICG